MSAIQSMFNYLNDGHRLTTRQARTLFKIENVADIVYRLRNEGVAVFTNRIKNSRGEKTFAYRLGNPSEQFSKYFGTGHVARARKTLYRNAIAVKMAA